MKIRALESADVLEWHRLRASLWPEEVTFAESQAFATELLSDASSEWRVLLCEDAGRILGFVEVRLREYADGCDSSPVGYIEGWYVVAERRGQGLGRALIDAGETWARASGCTEMASDALLDNEDSQRAHLALGFAEVERAVRYRKELTR